MNSNSKPTSRRFPTTFWVLILATFIDRLGGFILFPVFSVYVIDHFGVGITEVGLLFSIFSAGHIFGGMVGGALADKYGRRVITLIGLVASGMGSIFMGLVNELYLFYLIAAVLGTIGNFGGPARQAMVADLLPGEKQPEGFGMLRVAVNLSATIGPILSSFIAVFSFMLLFILDAISSLITAFIVFIVIPETKPQRLENEPEETVMKSFVGYKDVLKDGVYILFLSVSTLTVLVYMQLNTTLSAFLWEVHGFPIYGFPSFGWLLSLNALMVVVFQFWITKIFSKFSPMKVIALGTFFYMIGFGMYGFISETYMFFIAMAILTVGEMIAMPVGQTAAAAFAPEDKRGRYLAVYGFHWAIPSLFGVLLAANIWENLGPNWVWYFAGILSFIAMLGFWFLNDITNKRLSKKTESFTEELQDLDQKVIIE